MKKTLLSAALVLGLFPLGYANATICTTDQNYFLQTCSSCRLSTPADEYWFGSSELHLTCVGFISNVDDANQTTAKKIDDCVENREGTMGHGLGATQSCRDFTLADNMLHAECRNGAGDYLATSIDIREYFEYSHSFFRSGMRCAQ